MKTRSLAFVIIIILNIVFSMASCRKPESKLCNNIECKHGSACVSDTCACPVGYEGVGCETLSRDKFINRYAGRSNYELHIGPDSGIDTIVITAAKNDKDINIERIAGPHGYDFYAKPAAHYTYNDIPMTSNSDFSFKSGLKEITVKRTIGVAPLMVRIEFYDDTGALTIFSGSAF